jgi:hypothetical protein
MIAALLGASVLLVGCGVDFSGGAEGNDFFTSLRVTGDKVTGQPLTAAVSYETIYPAELEILCELRQGSTTLRQIGRGVAPAVLPERAPEDDGVVGNFSIDFIVEEPGTYKVECYTSKDDDNYLLKEFTVTSP